MPTRSRPVVGAESWECDEAGGMGLGGAGGAPKNAHSHMREGRIRLARRQVWPPPRSQEKTPRAGRPARGVPWFTEGRAYMREQTVFMMRRQTTYGSMF